jgi:hypothetical protein
MSRSFSKTRSEIGNQLKSGHFDASLPTLSFKAKRNNAGAALFAGRQRVRVLSGGLEEPSRASLWSSYRCYQYGEKNSCTPDVEPEMKVPERQNPHPSKTEECGTHKRQAFTSVMWKGWPPAKIFSPIVRGEQMSWSFSKTRSEIGNQFKTGQFDASLPTLSFKAKRNNAGASLFAGRQRVRVLSGGLEEPSRAALWSSYIC